MLNQKGQTLLIIIVLMAIALGVGITVSSRFISTLRTQIETDYSYRAQAVAVAGIENILLQDTETLRGFIQSGNCGSVCELEITGDDGVVASASMSLSLVGGNSDPVEVALSTTDVTEVDLVGYPNNTDVYICWDDVDSSKPSIVGKLVSGNVGTYIATPFAYNTISSPKGSNNFDIPVSSFGYENCITLNSGTSPQILRLRAIYDSFNAYVLPEASTDLPNQGVQIVSVGTVENTQKTVTVVVSDNLLPAEFDYALFSQSPTDNLTNFILAP